MTLTSPQGDFPEQDVVSQKDSPSPPPHGERSSSRFLLHPHLLSSFHKGVTLFSLKQMPHQEAVSQGDFRKPNTYSPRCCPSPIPHRSRCFLSRGWPLTSPSPPPQLFSFPSAMVHHKSTQAMGVLSNGEGAHLSSHLADSAHVPCLLFSQGGVPDIITPFLTSRRGDSSVLKNHGA